MFENLLLLLYLDQEFVKDLHSVMTEGFIESETIRYSIDTAANSKLALESRNRDECYKKLNAKGVSNVDSPVDLEKRTDSDKWFDAMTSFENKMANKADFEKKKIYFNINWNYSPSFVFYNDIYKRMHESNITTDFCYNYKRYDNMCLSCYEGDFIEFFGELTSISIARYVDSIRDIIDIYTPEALDKIISDSEFDGPLKFSMIDKFLLRIQESMCKCDTDDFVVHMDNCNILLCTYTCEFGNRHFHMYDTDLCKFKIWGKVIKKVDEGESVSLLRRTGQPDYYKRILENIEEYLDVLREKDIIIPEKPLYQIDGPSLLIRPISIHI